MPYARTDDRVRLYYEEHGTAGTPLVLAYGIGGNTDMWDTRGLMQGMDAMAEYAMTANPNLTARLALDPNAKAEFYEEYRRLRPVGYANSLRALIAMDHITDQLPELGRRRIPVLLVGGDRDPSLGPMRVIHRKIRGSKLVVLAPASHFANRDQPEAWSRAVLAFLARCDARAPRGSSRRA